MRPLFNKEVPPLSTWSSNHPADRIKLPRRHLLNTEPVKQSKFHLKEFSRQFFSIKGAQHCCKCLSRFDILQNYPTKESFTLDTLVTHACWRLVCLAIGICVLLNFEHDFRNVTPSVTISQLQNAATMEAYAI
jgi:hypothetical protein